VPCGLSTSRNPNLKILHLPFGFYPDPIGGTEVYVASLASQLVCLGAKVVVAAPADRADAYEHNGLRVRRFIVTKKVNDVRELYGRGDATAAQQFGNILDEERPDVVHLHALTRGVSLRLVREAKQRGSKVVFTYHTPTASCPRGTLMRRGQHVCDGVLELQKCASCTLNGFGLGRAGCALLSHVPIAVGRCVGRAGLSGRSWTALRMTELVELRQSVFHEVMQEADRIVALCDWVKDLLLHNGVPAEKITISRHGLLQLGRTVAETSEDHSPTSEPLRIAFLGRLDPTKGVDVMLRALRLLPELSVEFHIYGIVQGDHSQAYGKELEAIARDDLRVSFLPPIPSDGVVPILAKYHLLAVPSQWLETGPLVVLEAFAAGTPVIGSNLGGIRELVRHEVDGLLVEPGSVESWAKAIERTAKDRSLLITLMKGIKPPRSMNSVAEEMLALYQSMLGRASGSDGTAMPLPLRML
jgi:glycosyltransferase involved in cell wall biosynthesis